MIIFQNQKGVTLLEAVVSLTIFSMLMAALYFFYTQGMKIQQFGSEQQLAVESARKGIKEIVKELREAAAGDDGSYIITKADDQEIIFFSDIDSDLYAERVRYFLEDHTLKKGVIEPDGEPIGYSDLSESITNISEYVQNNDEPIFTYYNGDYPGDTINNPLPTPTRLTETKLINVYLEINVFPERAPSNIEIDSDVQIRNLKNNL
ncbi:prepilin-type N-terminal cleavage/methylation domain-containing protein [Patescibacteria group bacterium]|nr:prepilin-type N-terminal cleavage/methylation domain-containing protein [Patescibacteria group bacterium]MBU1890105.1 prepilin-type N-terminal cleavage/methylation domain-containing protein [Patescibacteria group bacterium]